MPFTASPSQASAPIAVPQPQAVARGRSSARSGTTPPSAHPCPQFADLVYSLFNAYKAGSERRASASARSPSPGSSVAAAIASNPVTRTTSASSSTSDVASAGRAFRS